jgi:secreted trypsin-like serine protease
MPKVVLVVGSMALAILLGSGVAQAIINGEPDRGSEAHPYVGALVSVPPSGEFKGQRIPVCSGTLISARVFLTAGHCTDFLMKKKLPTFVSFDPTYKPGVSEVMKATPYTHPKFCNADKEGCPRYDAGVVVLKKSVRNATYGALPDAGLVDTLKEGKRLTTVGYGATGYEIGSGLQPQPVYPEDRNKAMVRLLDTKDPALGEKFVKTTGVSLIKGKGQSACHGDSGGPLFMPDQQTIVGITSRGSPRVCRGPVYYQRMDLPGVLKWVRSFP